MTYFGVDLNPSFPSQADFDFARARSEGMSFSVVKFTEGASFRAAGAHNQVKTSLASNLYTVGYHFVTGGASAKDQAANLDGYLGDLQVRLALDLEPEDNSRPNFDKALAVRDELVTRGREVTLLYLPQWYWKQIGSPALDKCGLTLWSSVYGTNAVGIPTQKYPGKTGDGWKPYSGLCPIPGIWQFGSRVQVAGKTLDCNAIEDSSVLIDCFTSPTGAKPKPPVVKPIPTKPVASPYLNGVPMEKIPYPGASVYGPGKKNDHVLRLGSALCLTPRYAAHYSSGPSREWGAADQNAVSHFQRDQGWTGNDADGIPGPETYRRLGLG